MLLYISCNGRQDYYVHGEKNNRFYQAYIKFCKKRNCRPGGQAYIINDKIIKKVRAVRVRAI